MKVYVNIPGMRRTDTGKRKVWTTDGVATCCCSLEPCYLVREKATKANDYNPYSGYVAVKDCEPVAKLKTEAAA